MSHPGHMFSGFGAVRPPPKKPGMRPPPVVVPEGYQPSLPPGVGPDATPESRTGLYVGLGIAAVVVVGGAYLLLFKD